MRVRSQQWPWFAILVKTGREKTANLLLENAGYEFFLPVNRSTRRGPERTQLVDGRWFPVEEEEMRAIERVQTSGLSAMPWPYREVGNVAQTVDGPLRGLTGIVVKIKSGVKLVLFR